jgi:hypothetical protein
MWPELKIVYGEAKQTQSKAISEADPSGRAI